ncbi:helix-turn-helix domain-containing protein [Caloramator sp. Dgby_cultured_2]|uniref:helix-turn-helix domain-containing protein n=1 Tax=Caloramator sp. Dgby_cultured_2 TaxID=3029174 RepID=UPI00237ED57B|nr:helix-turn-helix transcriptional regulator [Caloramator sp. Dgby_cultured_2]WDU84241.1 helix-turn-helix transcriptional regulator [Caloramator sp. Dgby_cultured_2]
MATFQERMKELRKEKNLSLDKLSEMLNTTKATLSRYENGLRVPNIEFVEKLANIFNVSVDYLLGKTDVRNQEEINIQPPQTIHTK